MTSLRRCCRSVWIALLLPGCIAAMPGFAPPAGETVTVFVHGYKGSFLVTDDAERRVVWVSPGAALSSGKDSLALSYPGQPIPPSFSALTSPGPLTKLTVFPLVYSMDVYLSWMEHGRDQLQGFVPFAYDWRQDVVQSGRRLCAFLSALPAQKIRIVAHSMGGLVTWSCLSEDAALAARVKKIVFVGTPFRGGPGIFDDFFIGNTTGRDRALVSREALFTFPSSFQLLSAQSDFFFHPNGQPAALDAFSADAWISRRWGVFQGETGTPERTQLKKQLDHHAELHQRLAKPLLSSPKVLAVIGSGRPTVGGVVVTEAGGFDFDNPRMTDGDGSVMLTSASPPMPFTRFDTDAEHSVLLNDSAVRAAIGSFLAGD